MLCWAELLNTGMNQIGFSKDQHISIWTYNLEDPDSWLPVSNNILKPQQVDFCGIIGLTETKSEISDRVHLAILIQNMPKKIVNRN